MGGRMPALFIGHGNPMNALLANPYTQRWAAIGAALPRPKAILSVSAHWYIEDAAITVSTSPRTIPDFGGFPHELYHLENPAPGSVMPHVYQKADISIVQLSIDGTQPRSFHYEIGKRLTLLWEEGILIL